MMARDGASNRRQLKIEAAVLMVIRIEFQCTVASDLRSQLLVFVLLLMIKYLISRTQSSVEE